MTVETLVRGGIAQWNLNEVNLNNAAVSPLGAFKPYAGFIMNNFFSM